mmetsp:Transcript_92714/g.261824  ORF Transcript_92714/g.261824 Transcript_92714/m.261824 type:complete len:89 (-) Transcript_92714:1263-1529(-)
MPRFPDTRVPLAHASCAYASIGEPHYGQTRPATKTKQVFVAADQCVIAKATLLGGRPASCPRHESWPLMGATDVPNGNGFRRPCGADA